MVDPNDWREVIGPGRVAVIDDAIQRLLSVIAGIAHNAGEHDEEMVTDEACRYAIGKLVEFMTADIERGLGRDDFDPPNTNPN
jgi:hypothetical protein